MGEREGALIRGQMTGSVPVQAYWIVWSNSRRVTQHEINKLRKRSKKDV